MAYLIVGGVTVPVALGESSAETTEVGRRVKAYDGTARSSVRARKKEWSVPTRWMLRADWDTLYTALVGTPPVTCSGDMIGSSISCVVGDVTWDHQKFGDGERVKGSFTLQEA